MKTFFRWLASRLVQILLFLLFTAIFAVVFYLYNLPVGVVWYGFALCGVVGLVFCALDYGRTARRHRELSAAEKSLTALNDSLPQPEGLVESDYAEIIGLLRRENAALKGSYAVEREETDDYYTLWAHQIKTPIAAMRLLIQSGDGTLDTQGVRELESELFRTEQYVELALSYQRLNGADDLVIKRCRLDGIIRQAVRKYAMQFIRKGLALSYDGVDCVVLTDEKWLEFVIEQLLANALKYTATGGISIYMEEEKTLVIADTGIGIAPEDLPRVFEKGYTGYNGRADKKSTGIGLYLCRRILGQLGHTITAQSKPGEGTKVKLNLADSGLVVE